jgi:thiol:disulfide interchange protein DsbD
MKKIFIVLALLITNAVSGQLVDPIKWSFSSVQNGDEMKLLFKATIDKGWHLYDINLPEGGPISTQFVFEDSTLIEFAGEIQKSPAPVEKFDKTFEMNLRYFSDSVVFTQPVKLKKAGVGQIKGYVTFMGCDDESCLPPNDSPFSFTVKSENITSSGHQDSAVVSPEKVGQSQNQSPWLFLLISFLAGLAAVLTPCVFPMIPMTVSFFMRGSGNRKSALRTAFVFGFSIVGIFTLLGALFSIGVFGPNVGSILSTHWIPNLLFFVLFFIFALSFFGLFEIVLPGSLVNKADAKAESGGWVGAFFMALTTVIVSFSCTGPFIGALIIEAVQSGGLRPLMGMFVFGLAFATPFTLLALFPSAISKLPKSGGWLNSIKIVFAFILLAFGMKFLSNIDQVYGLNILSREIYLIIWIVLFSLLGLYFLGKIKFSHDSDVPYLSVGRFFLATVTFSFVLYLFTGLLGNPLKSISAIIPPVTITGSSIGGHGQNAVLPGNTMCGPAKYADKLHLPQGLQGYFEMKEGLACAKAQNKPALVVFKGHACANCKKMENSVWTDPETLQLISDKYVVIGLYTDDRSSLPESEWLTTPDGQVLKTMGKVNLQLQIEKYNTNSIPYHVIIQPDGDELKLAVTFDTGEFRDFIKKGLE